MPNTGLLARSSVSSALFHGQSIVDLHTHLGNCAKVRCKSGTHIDRLSRQWVTPGVESGGTPGVKDNRRSGSGRPKFQSTHSTSGHDGCGAGMGQPMMNQMSSVSGPMTLRQSGSTGRPCATSSRARQPAKPWRISAPQVDALCRAVRRLLARFHQATSLLWRTGSRAASITPPGSRCNLVLRVRVNGLSGNLCAP